MKKTYTEEDKKYYCHMRVMLIDRIHNMTKEKKIETLEEQNFLNQMIDRWSREDYIFNDLINDLLKEVEENEI